MEPHSDILGSVRLDRRLNLHSNFHTGEQLSRKRAADRTRSSVEFSSIQPIRTDVEKCTNDEDPLSADRDQLNLHRWVRSRSRGRGRRGIRNCKPTHREGGKKFDSSLPDHKNGTHGLEFPATATCLYYDGKYRMTDWYGSLSLPWSDGTERRRESHASVVLNWFCSLYSPTKWNHSQSGWWASVRLSVGAEKER